MANAYNRNTGRTDTEQSAIMKVMRRPAFVDNAIVHGEYTKTVTGHKVVPPTKTDFIPSHDRTYKLVEEEDGIRVLHNSSYDQAVFFNTTKLDANGELPLLIYAKQYPKNRLVPTSIETSSTGSRLTLKNLRGRTLSDIGFTEQLVRMGQSVDVGLRTTDLAMRLIDGAGGSINSAKVDKKRHSTTFLSYDFVGSDAISALRFVSKHDGQGARGDQFGNLIYTQQNQMNKEHYVSNNMASSVISDNIKHTPNRVMVHGKKRANNVDNIIRVEDVGAQVDGVVNEMTGGIHIPTASTEASARRIGQRILATAQRSNGLKQFSGVIKSLNVRPGDHIHYDSSGENTRGMVLSTNHNLSQKLSEFQISATSTSVEDILQRFQEVQLNTTEGEGQSNDQLNTRILSTGIDVKLNPSWTIRTKVVRKMGFIIGHPTRGRIHGDTNVPEAVTEKESRIRLCKTQTKIIARG